MSIFITSLFAVNNGYWGYQKKVTLKKDEFFSLNVVEGSRNRKLYFRWTLFINDGLVFMLNYDRFNKQTILYQDYKLSGFKLYLAPKDVKYEEEPFMFIEFREFDKEKKVATFEIFVHDTKGRMFIDDKKR